MFFLSHCRFCSAALFPAASFMSFQQCKFNFGAEPFRYPPKRFFNVFNDVGKLKPQDKVRVNLHPEIFDLAHRYFFFNRSSYLVTCTLKSYENLASPTILVLFALMHLP